MNHIGTSYAKETTSCGQLMEELLNTTTSTSEILQRVSNQSLKVQVLFQTANAVDNHMHIIRESKLYFKSPDCSLMYCSSSFSVNTIFEAEISQLKLGHLPIGVVFGVKNISKSEITVRRLSDPSVGRCLKLSNHYLYHKEYGISIRGEKVGCIREVFNEESLMKIWA
jgi:chorismate-pyruvate lyase